MSLREQITADFKQAMLDHDEVKKTTLNGLKSAIRYKEVEKGAGAELDDAEIEAVVASQVKSRNDSIAIYEQNNQVRPRGPTRNGPRGIF